MRMVNTNKLRFRLWPVLYSLTLNFSTKHSLNLKQRKTFGKRRVPPSKLRLFWISNERFSPEKKKWLFCSELSWETGWGRKEFQKNGEGRAKRKRWWKKWIWGAIRLGSLGSAATTIPLHRELCLPPIYRFALISTSLQGPWMLEAWWICCRIGTICGRKEAKQRDTTTTCNNRNLMLLRQLSEQDKVIGYGEKMGRDGRLLIGWWRISHGYGSWNVRELIPRGLFVENQWNLKTSCIPMSNKEALWWPLNFESVLEPENMTLLPLRNRVVRCIFRLNHIKTRSLLFKWKPRCFSVRKEWVGGTTEKLSYGHPPMLIHCSTTQFSFVRKK